MNGIGSAAGSLPQFGQQQQGSAAAPPETQAPAAPQGDGLPRAGAPDTLEVPASDGSGIAQMHPQFQTMTQDQVAVLRAIAMPDAMIAQINGEAYPTAELEEWIAGSIMTQPDQWDSALGNPPGTARTGLELLMPGFSFPGGGQPPAWTGQEPGSTDDGSQQAPPPPPPPAGDGNQPGDWRVGPTTAPTPVTMPGDTGMSDMGKAGLVVGALGLGAAGFMVARGRMVAPQVANLVRLGHEPGEAYRLVQAARQSAHGGGWRGAGRTLGFAAPQGADAAANGAAGGAYAMGHGMTGGMHNGVVLGGPGQAFYATNGLPVPSEYLSQLVAGALHSDGSLDKVARLGLRDAALRTGQIVDLAALEEVGRGKSNPAVIEALAKVKHGLGDEAVESVDPAVLRALLGGRAPAGGSGGADMGAASAGGSGMDRIVLLRALGLL